MTERTLKYFAIEHAEYMAKDAERLLDALSEHAAAYMVLEEGSDEDADQDITAIKERCEQADEALGEHMAHMRSGIYEFRKRRDRALAAPSQPEGAERDAALVILVALGWVITEMDPASLPADAKEVAQQVEKRFLSKLSNDQPVVGPVFREARRLLAGAAAPDEGEARDAALWRAHRDKLDALVTYCPTCCQGFTAKAEMSRDEVIFECGKTAGRAALSAPKGEESSHG